jgi:transcriptional regulator with XRE-family HTH domain
MADEPWTQPGYSDIEAVDIVDDRLVVRFANGDTLDLPPSLISDREGASVDFDPEEALEVVVRDGDAERRISWTQLRAATDPAFAQHLRELDAEESRRLGRRLKALREDRGIRQAELAALMPMPAPQLSKIEAGAHDMRLSTVRGLLRALGATFADVSGDVPEVPVKTLTRRLTDAGLPREAGQRLLRRLPRESINTMLDRAVGWSREALVTGELRPRQIPAAVQFKSGPKQVEQTPLVHLAWKVARSGRAASDVGPYTGFPDAASEVRAAAAGPGGQVTLASLLNWTWAQGVPVLPMLGKGVFSAAVWAHEDGPVVVLKESRDLGVFWLFDLAHEIGHIARGHVDGRSIVDLASPTSPQVLGSDDRQEREATAFALALLVPNHEALLAEVRQRTAGNYLAFKGAVATTARRHGMSGGVLGMVAAYAISEVGEHKDRWGSATNLAKVEGGGRAVVTEGARARLQVEQLDELDRALIETIVLGD